MSKEHKSGSHLPEILQTAVLQTVKVDPLVPAFARDVKLNFLRWEDGRCSGSFSKESQPAII